MTGNRPTGRDPAGYQYHRSGPVTLYLGDAADVLAAMPDGSVDAVVTSPPFWSLLHWASMVIDWMAWRSRGELSMWQRAV